MAESSTIDSVAVYAAFAKLSGRMQIQYLEAIAIAGILVIQIDAVNRVKKVTGNLARSILHKVVVRNATQIEVVCGPSDEGAPYGRRIEFGFNQADSLGRVFHQPAQPYLRPAYDEHWQEAIEEMRNAAFDALLK